MKNEYEIRGDVAAIFIKSKGITFECLIDTEDLGKVGIGNNTYLIDDEGYVRGRTVINGKRIGRRIHRIVTNCPAGLHVDHIYHDKLDNRKSQLRCVSAQDNICNPSRSRKDNLSGHRGVSWNKDLGQWAVLVRLDGKTVFRKCFDKEQLEEAKKTADHARAHYMPSSKESREIENPDMNLLSMPDDTPTRANKISGVKNVKWCKLRKRWVVEFTVNYVTEIYGIFESLTEAANKASEVRKYLKKKAS